MTRGVAQGIIRESLPHLEPASRRLPIRGIEPKFVNRKPSSNLLAMVLANLTGRFAGKTMKKVALTSDSLLEPDPGRTARSRELTTDPGTDTFDDGAAAVRTTPLAKSAAMPPLASGPDLSTFSPAVLTSEPPAVTGRVSVAGEATERQWQLRLLPLMSRMIVGLTVFFFVASLAQFVYLDRTIEHVPVTDLARLGILPPSPAQPVASPEFRILASLDAALLERRYHQANVFLMGRL